MLEALLALLLLFTGLWLVSLALGNASIVDLWWGPAFVLALLVYLHGAPPPHTRGWLVLGAVVLWAVRLSWHIGRRNIGHGEDPRYRAWRQEHGPRWWWRSYFQVFALQALVAWLVSWPLFFAVQAGPAFPTAWDILGGALFAAGFGFESVADGQLSAFRRNPANRGQVMDRGLWRYSRHPNYFGESMLWWGLGVVALSAPGGWLGLVGPLLMTVLLLKVSGVALLERGLMTSRAGYAEYVARTSAFVPRPPRAQG